MKLDRQEGESRNNLDEKGRLLVPSRLRAALGGGMLVVTKGIDTCLWLFTQEEWRRISENLMESTSLFDPKARLIRRHIIAPAVEIEIDKAGRINIPPALREAAGLTKECVILGIENYIEIWDEAEYRSYQTESELDFKEAAKELSKILSI
ncbi:MAG: division/cell wall cluster transcriptional repressor MraZ [Anaerolineae bacterium]